MLYKKLILFKPVKEFVFQKEFLMKKYLLLVFLLSLCFACNSKETEAYTFDKLKDEFKENFGIIDLPVGTYFWEEFGEMEAQYGLKENESKLLGEWVNVTFVRGPFNNSYAFFPNKLFLLRFNPHNFRIVNAEEMYFNKALGSWDIIDGIVQITIYAIITEDKTRKYPYNKDVLLVEQPYTVDFINIDDIGEEGFTKRPINDTVLSQELQKTIKINKPNMTNNLYVRSVYTIDYMTNSGKPEKNYGYFRCFPEMARENHSGLDIATNPELIKKYIPDWMF
jgi:hypothetical protein